MPWHTTHTLARAAWREAEELREELRELKKEVAGLKKRIYYCHTCPEWCCSTNCPHEEELR